MINIVADRLKSQKVLDLMILNDQIQDLITNNGI